jgi:signal transduction histidine kinase
LTLERDKGMRVTNLIRHPDFIDYIILGRYEQPLTLSFRDRKLICQIIPFENRRQILVTHDATETQRIEEMRRDFIANASHELRTPLTVIVGFLEIASSEMKLDEATRMGHLKLMTEQGHRMQRLIEDMLTLSRLESVDYPLRPELVDVGAMVEEILQEARALSGGTAHRDGQRGRARHQRQRRRIAQRLRQPGLERGALHAAGRHDPSELAERAGGAAVCRQRYRHRHRPEAHSAADRALLPGRQEPFARDAGDGAGAGDRQARAAAPRRNPEHQVGSREGQQLHRLAAGPQP